MKAKLVNVGRNMYNGEITFNSFRTLNNEIKKHVASRDWALSFGDGDTTAGIILAGRMAKIGTVELINAKFKVLNENEADVIPIEKPSEKT